MFRPEPGKYRIAIHAVSALEFMRQAADLTPAQGIADSATEDFSNEAEGTCVALTATLALIASGGSEIGNALSAAIEEWNTPMCAEGLTLALTNLDKFDDHAENAPQMMTTHAAILSSKEEMPKHTEFVPLYPLKAGETTYIITEDMLRQPFLDKVKDVCKEEGRSIVGDNLAALILDIETKYKESPRRGLLHRRMLGVEPKGYATYLRSMSYSLGTHVGFMKITDLLSRLAYFSFEKPNLKWLPLDETKKRLAQLAEAKRDRNKELMKKAPPEGESEEEEEEEERDRREEELGTKKPPTPVDLSVDEFHPVEPSPKKQKKVAAKPRAKKGAIDDELIRKSSRLKDAEKKKGSVEIGNTPPRQKKKGA